MNVVCLDLEGVLVPEIWIAFAEATNIPELKKTTRDEPDYDKLMSYRLGILKEHGLGLKEIQDVIATIDPMPGAKEFLDELRFCNRCKGSRDFRPGTGKPEGTVPGNAFRAETVPKAQQKETGSAETACRSSPGKAGMYPGKILE